MDATDLARENALLKARLAEVEASLAESQEANRRLQDILRIAQREKFGKRSEKLSPDQFNLPLEDAEFAQGVLEAAQEKAEAAMQRARGKEPRKPEAQSWPFAVPSAKGRARDRARQHALPLWLR
jgi:transposase